MAHFREAAESGYSWGDRKRLPDELGQLRRGPLEVQLDIEVGADMVMVNPSIPYLDVL